MWLYRPLLWPGFPPLQILSGENSFSFQLHVQYLKSYPQLGYFKIVKTTSFTLRSLSILEKSKGHVQYLQVLRNKVLHIFNVERMKAPKYP